jgi:SAM-dependent methyltransferase
VTYRGIQGLLPGPVRRHVLHFESAIEEGVRLFAASLPNRSRVLDAGAGEGQYAGHFRQHLYTGVDLGIGDEAWNYGQLGAIANLENLPFADATFDASLNVVTLEHVQKPDRVIAELARTLRPGGRLLLIVPHEWEEHQQPHDYFRYTRYGLRYLLEAAGFREIRIEPVGGFFRLLSRRLFNAVQFFPGPLVIVGLLLFAPAALLVPLLEPLDKQRNFTLGFVCTAVR